MLEGEELMGWLKGRKEMIDVVEGVEGLMGSWWGG